MKVLLSTIGSRGDVQPLLALAVELRALGHEARLCVAPNFRDWVESFGFECVPIGPDLRQLPASAGTAPAAPPDPERLRQLATFTVRTQFQVLSEAARGCDLIVGATALQLAAQSIAEALRIPYRFVSYAPVVLPSSDHPPPVMGPGHPMTLPAEQNDALWQAEAQRWNAMFGPALNEERERLGLARIEDVMRHVLTDRPWLAADPVLAPPPSGTAAAVVQSGAWLLEDRTPLPEEVERFLDAGEPPIYFGFGSMRATPLTGRMLVESARALGKRTIVSKGWGNLTPGDAGDDCLSIDEVAHDRLFPRVAAVVHHGGAGTTTAAALAGVPQLLVPHLYDQPWWAHRIQALDAGVSGGSNEPLTVERLTGFLAECLQPDKVATARALALRMKRDGAAMAARKLWPR